MKLPSQNVSQVVHFKLLLRDISLRTFFLNSVRFDLLENVDMSFLNTYMNGRFVQWRWSENLWQIGLLCSATVAKISFFVMQLSVWEINHIQTAVYGHPQWSLKCWPNRISYDVFARCFNKVETTACGTLRSCAKRLGASRSRLRPGPRKGVTRGEGEHNTRAPNHYEGAEKSKQCHKYFLQYSTFTFEKMSGLNMGAPNLLLALATLNLVTSLGPRAHLIRPWFYCFLLFYRRLHSNFILRSFLFTNIDIFILTTKKGFLHRNFSYLFMSMWQNCACCVSFSSAKATTHAVSPESFSSQIICQVQCLHVTQLLLCLVQAHRAQNSILKFIRCLDWFA